MDVMVAYDRLVAMLRKHEWDGWANQYESVCPECSAERQEGHAEDCELALLLAANPDKSINRKLAEKMAEEKMELIVRCGGLELRCPDVEYFSFETEIREVTSIHDSGYQRFEPGDYETLTFKCDRRKYVRTQIEC